MEKIEKAARAALVLCILFLVAGVVLLIIDMRGYSSIGNWSSLREGVMSAAASLLCLSQALIWGFLRYVLRAWLQKEHWN